MASMHRLTARTVAHTKKPGLYPDGAGLYLQVTIGRDGSPRRSWVMRFTAPNGRRREMGLGPAPLVDLATAREKALAARRKVAEGEDESLSFGTVCLLRRATTWLSGTARSNV